MYLKYRLKIQVLPNSKRRPKIQLKSNSAQLLAYLLKLLASLPSFCLANLETDFNADLINDLSISAVVLIAKNLAISLSTLLL